MKIGILTHQYINNYGAFLQAWALREAISELFPEDEVQIIDYVKVKAVLERIIAADERILTTPAPFIGLGALSASSVDIKVRVWTKTENYWDVYFDMNKIVYDTFNKEGIGFPFPQLTVHQAKD